LTETRHPEAGSAARLFFFPPIGENPVNVTTTRPTTRNDLERQVRREGFAPGLPHNITEATVRTDKAAYRRMRCPGCGRKRMEFYPWHRGRAYRVLAGCSECGAAEED
jgi:hypothetical protein